MFCQRPLLTDLNAGGNSPISLTLFLFHFFSCARRGTKNFIAPEVLEEKVHTSAIDIFSAGCVFYNFIQGHAPGLTKT